ncbi:T9SS type A sorting domain-containing protein, partial [candidate division WOR-3 bacterium]|nr:T9SS type A sorting domain-containing protein [candidate division WOR-3 bacterium]
LGFFGYGNWIGGLSGQWCRQMVNALKWVSVSHDVGCSKLIAPAGIIDSGQSVVPACSLYNYGNQVETYRVRMRIGPYNDTARVTAHQPGTRQYVTFPGWTATARGNFTASCSTELTDDSQTTNDKATANGFVRVTDAGVVSISRPSGTYPQGATVRPNAVWRNYGNTAATFQAWAILIAPGGGRPYAEYLTVSGLSPGSQVNVTAFPDYVVTEGGQWTVKCSTGYVGDQIPANDTLSAGFTVLSGNPDISVEAIVAPTGRVDTGDVVTPQGRVRNRGDINVPFRAWFILNDPTDVEVYRQFVDVTGLAVGAETTLSFPTHNVGTNEGTWATRCSVYVSGDVQPNNDYRSGTFTVGGPALPPGWVEVSQVPGSPSGKAVKDGGWLVETRDQLFVAKGNKTGDFYSYDPETNVWTTLPAWPNGAEGKGPKKGAAACADGEYIYATKGANTLGFWRYHIDSLTWTQFPDVPLGTSGKKVKGGTDLVYLKAGTGHDTGYVYLLKGYKQEFLRFNPETMAWEALPDAPAGSKPKWDKGSWLAVQKRVGPEIFNIWAHKAKYHEMYVFDAVTLTWGPLITGMPFLGSLGKNKKSKDGGCGVYDDDALWALKGGNTGEFWRYDVLLNSWAEKTPMPEVGSTGKKKRVKAGGDIVSFGDDIFYALKGNKTLELWRYVESTGVAARPLRSGVMAGPRVLTGFWATIVPNPLAGGLATLHYSLPGSGPALLRIYDVSGRTVLTRSLAASRRGTASLDLRSLARGVYLVKLEGGALRTTTKLVVE